MDSKLLIYMFITILDYKLILISSMVEQNTSNIPILVRIWNEKRGGLAGFLSKLSSYQTIKLLIMYIRAW